VFEKTFVLWYNDYVNKLNKNIFWDAAWEKLNEKKDANFIIRRVLEWGDISDFQSIRRMYSRPHIKKVIYQTHFANKKSENFWRIIY